MDISEHDDPIAILLNLTPLSRKCYHKSLLKHLLNAACAYIPRMWEKNAAKMVTQWIARLNDIEEMEDLMEPPSRMNTLNMYELPCPDIILGYFPNRYVSLHSLILPSVKYTSILGLLD